MYKNTKAILSDLHRFMDTDNDVQAILEESYKNAKGVSKEEVKNRLFQLLFFKMLTENKDIAKIVAREYGDKIWDEVHKGGK